MQYLVVVFWIVFVLAWLYGCGLTYLYTVGNVDLKDEDGDVGAAYVFVFAIFLFLWPIFAMLILASLTLRWWNNL